MDYNPDDQRVTFRQVLAGWIFCLSTVGLAFAAIGQHHAVPSANADNPPHAVTASCCPPSGVRLPYFAPCAPEQRGTITTAPGPMSLPANPCS
jgi:hypothetical protein